MSGILLYMLRIGGRWRGVLAEYGSVIAVYYRLSMWSRRGFWRAMLVDLVEAGWIAPPLFTSAQATAAT